MKYSSNLFGTQAFVLNSTARLNTSHDAPNFVYVFFIPQFQLLRRPFLYNQKHEIGHALKIDFTKRVMRQGIIFTLSKWKRLKD